jgi:8-oxo-dGTP diphosphatase
VVWRPGRNGAIEICLIHRQRYGDWSLPKGKLHAREHPLAAAVREVAEETGVTAVPQVRLPTIGYRMAGGTAKTVEYWSMRAVADAGLSPNDEVDEALWVPLAEAADRLSYDHDADVVRRAGALPPVTGIVVLVRHAHAGERAEWNGPDALRPLDSRGRHESEAVADLLTVFGPARLITATPDRCRQSLAPLAARLKQTLEPDALFDETADPTATADRLRALAQAESVTVICSQGKLIPKALGRLLDEPPTGFATAKGSGWLLAFSGADPVATDRITP